MNIKGKIKKEEEELDKIYKEIKNKINNDYKTKIEENNLIENLNNEINKVKKIYLILLWK